MEVKKITVKSSMLRRGVEFAVVYGFEIRDQNDLNPKGPGFVPWERGRRSIP